MSDLKAKGIGRDAGGETALTVVFSRTPTDGEVRAVHDFLRRTPAICPFCSQPTYALPCTNCGEPDTDEQF